MSLRDRQLLRGSALLLVAVFNAGSVFFARDAIAQVRPSGGEPRPWISGAIGVASERQNCMQCGRPGKLGGLSATLAGGVSLPDNFGVALAVTSMTEFSFEYSQRSQYIVGLLQYSPTALSNITLNFGGGRGRHDGDEPYYSNNGSGAVIALGAALRLPRSGAVAAILSANLFQSLSGSTPLIAQPSTNQTVSYRPRLLTFGFGLTLAPHLEHSNKSSAQN